MKKRWLIVSAILSATLLFAANSESFQEKAKQSMMKLGSTLKGELKMKMKEDPGGLKAVEYCATQAQEITKKVNEELGADVLVHRTALKYRNAANKPTADEVTIMKDFQERIEQKGEDQKGLMKVVEGEKTYTTYKALGVGKPCLKCHGSIQQMNKQVLSVLDEKYPDDMARDFKQGDFRGMIVVTIQKP